MWVISKNKTVDAVRYALIVLKDDVAKPDTDAWFLMKDDGTAREWASWASHGGLASEAWAKRASLAMEARAVPEQVLEAL